ncbi:hypothetical protein C2857_004091 [Epichloe festucae Fl1]|uniref:Uncharacterized protein n=1 Tax=Epichloe festucae (strain Fl1) TaxID=877507 RepID=A0A7S9KP06_EPIFF|nr:hypothetical protein C2857_004091 [Epichloe festucae Fl1]
MTGLPPNWEWDYDGQRWFYKYKPTGHIQFHFPSEGDEFPDFVQAGEPAPNLAPEERLASQQQVKRQAGTAGPNEHTKKAGGEQIANTLGMSATAKPVSTVWEGDNEEEAVFQPENFMFLGPGTYADVSPLNEEEEEATKRAVTGGIGERETGASPLGSGKTTPMMGKSEISSSTTPATNAFKAAAAMDETVDTKHSPSIESPTTSGDNTVANMIESEPVASQPVEADLAFMLAEDPGTQAFHILDSRDMPVEMLGDTAHRFDPVGLVAEMPTEHTGMAHIELHPDPVEIADNSILAPTETMQCTNLDLAELPEKNSPVAGKGKKKICIFKTPEGNRSTEQARTTTEAVTLQTVDSKQEQKAPAEGQFTDVRNHHTQTPRTNGEQSSQPAPKLETCKMTGKQPGSTPGTPIQSQSQSQSTYQTHVPGHPSTSQAATPDKRHSVSPQRDASLTLNLRRESISMDPSTVPKVLLPTHDPSKSVQTTAVESETEQRRKERGRDWEAGLARVPSSVLKPARNQRHSIQSPPQQSQQQHQREQRQVPGSGSPAGYEGSSQAMNQFPPRPDGLPNQQNSESSADGQNIATTTQPGPDRPHVSQLKTQPNSIVPGSSENCQCPPQSWQSWQGQTLPKRRASLIPTLGQEQSMRPQTAVGGTISSGPASTALASSNRPFDQTSKEDSPLILEFQVPQSQNVHNMAAGQSQLRRPTAPMFPANASPLQNAQDMAVGQPRLQQAPSVAQPVAPAVAPPNPQGEQQPATTSSFNVPPLRNIQNAAAGQPFKPQSPHDDQSRFPAERQQFGPAKPMQPGIRRTSAFTPEDATTRSRADSQVSSISQTPADPYMRRSSNPLVNGPNYTSSPLTDNNAGSDALNKQPATATTSTSTTAQGQSSPVPAQVRANSQGPFFTAQSAPHGQPSKYMARPELQQQQHAANILLQSQLRQGQHQPVVPPKVSQAQPSQQQSQQRPDLEYPIGYHVKPTSGQPGPAAPANQQSVTSPAPGYLLGEIEEYEEQEQALKPSHTPQVTRPRSIASSLQQSMPDAPSGSQGPPLLQPKPLAVSQVQRPTQQLGQPPMAQPTMGQPPPAQPCPGVMPPDQMQGQMPSGPVPQGPPQGRWNPEVTHAHPPQEFQGGKGKEKKWTRWFKGGSSKSKAPQQAQMMPPHSGPIPGPRPEPRQWAAGGPFSPAHIWQPGQQGPAGMAPHGQGQCPSISDSASIPTLSSDRKSRHGQQLPAGQSTMPGTQNLVPGGGQEQAPGQSPPGQTLQGQMYARRMPQMPSGDVRQAQAPLQIIQGAAGQPTQSQFLPGQMHPSHFPQAQSTGQGPTAQMSSQGSPARMPPVQTYFGQMHPLSMPLDSPSQGHTTTQPGLRPQGQGIQGAPSSGQMPMGHSKTASDAGHSAPLQNQPPQQHLQQQSKEQNLTPAPLLAVASGSRPAFMQDPGHQVVANEKWAQNPAADYSGVDWESRENWGRR